MNERIKAVLNETIKSAFLGFSSANFSVWVGDY